MSASKVRGRSVLDLSKTSVDRQFKAVDKACIIRGKECDGLSNLFRFANPARRRGARGRGREIVDLRRSHTQRSIVARGRNNARADRIDADVAALQIHAPSPRKVAYRGLG